MNKIFRTACLLSIGALFCGVTGLTTWNTPLTMIAGYFLLATAHTLGK